MAVHACPHCNGRGAVALGSSGPLAVPLRPCITCKGSGHISTVMTLEAPFMDVRGGIQNLLHERVGSVVVINSAKGTMRAQHWHKTDWHFCYVLSGHIVYKEAPLVELHAAMSPTYGRRMAPDRSKLETHNLPAGTLFYTPPHVAHAMYFPEDTVFLTLGNRSRTVDDHESDLVRLAAEDQL